MKLNKIIFIAVVVLIVFTFLFNSSKPQQETSFQKSLATEDSKSKTKESSVDKETSKSEANKSEVDSPAPVSSEKVKSSPISENQDQLSGFNDNFIFIQPNISTEMLVFPVKEIPQAKGLLICLLYTSPSPRDQRGSRMPSSA